MPARLGSEDRVWKPRPLKRVVILGMGAGSKMFHYWAQTNLPMDDAEVWAVNAAAFAFKHDLAWNTHILDRIDLVETDKNFVEKYKKLNTPLMTLKAMDELPNSWEYPLAEVIEEFQDDYFVTAFPYMLAFAGVCGVEDAYLFGVDYDYKNRENYAAGRCCAEYWIGRLRGRMNVHILGSSTLLDTRYRLPGGKGVHGYGAVYGYFDEQPRLGLAKDGKVFLEGFDPRFEDIDKFIETYPQNPDGFADTAKPGLKITA